MRFHGTQQECAEIIAQLDAAHGYPRGYTQADLDSGVISRVGGGIHVPLDQIRTETVAVPAPAAMDEDGKPVGGERVAHLPPLAEHREIVGKARVLQVLNRGDKAALLALPDIGDARADAIIAERSKARLTSLEDVAKVLPTHTIEALEVYAKSRTANVDEKAVPVRIKAAGVVR